MTKLIPEKDFVQVVSFGLLAIRQTTLGLKKSIAKKVKMEKQQRLTDTVNAQKLMDSREKSDKEAFLEAKNADPTKPNASDEKSKKKGSWWSRFMRAIGWVIVGYIADKLPQIIKAIESIIQKIKPIIETVKSIWNWLTTAFKEIGDVLKQVWANIKKLDFLDSEDKVKSEFREMEKNLGDANNKMLDSFKDIRKLITNYGKQGDADVSNETLYGDRGRNEILPADQQKEMFNDQYHAPENNGGEREELLHVNYKSILDMLADNKKASYTSVGDGNDEDLTKKTINEIMQMDAASVGRYGFDPKTLKTKMNLAVLSGDDLFTPENQDKMGESVLVANDLNDETTIEEFEVIIERLLGKDLDEESVKKAYNKFRNQLDGAITGDNADTSSIINSSDTNKKKNFEIVPIDTDTSGENTDDKIIPTETKSEKAAKFLKVKKETRKMTMEEMKIAIANQKDLVKKYEEEGRSIHWINSANAKLSMMENGLRSMRRESGDLTEGEKMLRDSGNFTGTSEFSATTTTRTIVNESDLSLNNGKKVVEVPMPIINNNNGSGIPMTMGGDGGGEIASSSGPNVIEMLHTANSHFT